MSEQKRNAPKKLDIRVVKSNENHSILDTEKMLRPPPPPPSTDSPSYSRKRRLQVEDI